MMGAVKMILMIAEENVMLRKEIRLVEMLQDGRRNPGIALQGLMLHDVTFVRQEEKGHE